ncbi:MAG: hypothetical protein IJI14_10045 [Anaerolineaceae bacterium]|nr:hypothetical protein [Anaerolineaceae bacterium]
MTDLNDFLTEDEWELLCDCCALCCLYKVQDEDTGEVFYTSVVCPLLNKENAHCSCYRQRFKKMPTCMKISPESLPKMAHWLPKSCAYRCLIEGIQLPKWHPLLNDPSPEAAALKEKLSSICVRPNTCISKNTADHLIQESKTPRSMHKLTRLLLANVIEDIDI